MHRPRPRRSVLKDFDASRKELLSLCDRHKAALGKQVKEIAAGGERTLQDLHAKCRVAP